MIKPRVAICQPFIILGGRLQVILGFVRALNKLGIEPEILTFGLSFDPKQIHENYGQDLKMRFRLILRGFPWKIIPQDFQILKFNGLLKYFIKDYQLIIDSGNSQLFLPNRKNILSYVHFPREKRLLNLSDRETTSDESAHLLFPIVTGRIINWFYRVYKRTPDHPIICNSNYSKRSILEVFPEMKSDEIQVVYPPVDSTLFESKNINRKKSIISLGRFSPDKRQLDQIIIAQRIPQIEFHIVGFVNNRNYFEKCKNFIEKNNIANVILHPDATLQETIKLLRSSKYFLHTSVNEPFGVTAVQAIASGCFPLVHNSGGQQETVPYPELRFSSMEDIPEMISNLETRNQKEMESILNALQEHARKNFDRIVFEEKMTEVIRQMLAWESQDTLQ